MKGLLTYETVNLAIALFKIKRFMHREKLHKGELARAVDIARQSDEAKGRFTYTIKKHIKQKINFLVQHLNAFYNDYIARDGLMVNK